jgi:divalent metal cation (Fe/Co/Zn/Cd) transporter
MNEASRDGLYKTAFLLAVITIAYNILEGIVSVWFGAEDQTLALFGFGIDSFVEVISGTGILHMVRRIRSGGSESVDAYEQRALRITGWAFFLLTAGLVVSSGLSLYERHRPDSTQWGIIVSLVSIASMWLLIHYKTKVGVALGSKAILADAACSRVCVQLSVVLLAASAGYGLTGIGGFDSVGALLIAFVAFREGREAIQKAKRLSRFCIGECES